MKESKDLNKDDVAAPEYKSSLPNIDWNISSIHTVDVALNQAARVRQMLRTRKLQLQLETDIKTLAWRRSNESNRANLQSTKSAGVQMMTTSPRKSDGCPQTRINELEKKLSDLQQTTEDHADLSAALASEESKERVEIQLHTTTSFVASKFLTVCKWRASSNVAQKRNQVIDHQWRREYVEKVRKEIIRASAREHQNAIIECVEKQVKESVEECKRMLMNRLRPLELQLSRIQCLIQKTKDHHLQSVESMVSSALLSRNGNKMTQLTTTLSPAITARFSPRAALRDALKEFHNDRDVAMEAIKQNSNALEFASKDLKNDYVIVLEAVKKGGTALKHASKELQNNMDIVRAAVKQNPQSIMYASIDLRGNEEIVLIAVERWGLALKYASVELRANKQVVLKAGKQSSGALKYASTELQNDQTIQYLCQEVTEELPMTTGGITRH